MQIGPILDFLRTNFAYFVASRYARGARARHRKFADGDRDEVLRIAAAPALCACLCALLLT